MRPAYVTASVIAISLGPWLLAELVYTYIRQSSGGEAATRAIGSPAYYFWAVFIFAVASAWFAFARLLRYGSVAAVSGAVGAFVLAGAFFGAAVYLLMAYAHIFVFGGSL
jgi:hypothetical protein